MTTRRRCLLSTFVALMGAPSARASNAEHAAEFAGTPPWEMPAAKLGERGSVALPLAPERKPLKRKVFGYYPYWGGDWTQTRFDLLTSLCYLGVAVNSDGAITDRNGWGGPTANALVAEAKRWGVKVSVSAILFSSSGIATLVGDPARRAAAITNLVTEVRSGGGEGVNIDFEFVPVAAKANFVTFMRELTTRMHSEFPGSEVTIAMPSVDSTGAYDYDQLVANSDGLFIMGYGYHWSGGPPGPLAPARSGAIWHAKDLKWTIDDYVRYGGPNVREKLLLGLPWYGYNWPATSDAVPGTRRTGSATAVSYRQMAALVGQHGRRWDGESGTPYLVWEDSGGWRQLWYDDGESWRAKLDLVNTENLGGVGIWALTYERGTTDLWDAIEEKLVVADSGVDAGPRDGGGTDADAAADAGAGAGADSGAAPETDAGAAADAGVDAGPTPPPPGLLVVGRGDADSVEGCACGVTSAGTSFTAVGALVASLVVVAVRRRRGRRQSRGNVTT